MKIAQIAPVIERVPPEKYGGTERVIYTLTEELVKRGHDVTLFASGDSKTSAKLVSVYPKSLRAAKLENIYGTNEWSLINYGLAYKQQFNFDIIHDHTYLSSLPTASLASVPVVMTLHGAFHEGNIKLYESFPEPFFVSISKNQSELMPPLNYLGTVYNGLNMEHYPFNELPGGYLLFVGRISRQKGVHHAIEVAQYLDLPLIIAAKLDYDQPHDVSYFKEYIEPKLSDQIRWVGEVNEAERNKLMSNALCFLHPVTWREPFGLTLIESMACGCPVVAFNQGSIPEIVRNGKTGFVVNSLEEMVSAVSKILKIDRRYCRNYALKRFNASVMAQGYEEMYKRAIMIHRQKRQKPQRVRQEFYYWGRSFAHEIQKIERD